MRRPTTLLVSGLLVALALSAVPASRALAQSEGAVDPQLEAARELIFQARFGDAVSAARTILNRQDLSASARNSALEVLATAQVADRQQDDAEQTLQLLYSRDPGHRLNDADASPPVISAFARARESNPHPVPVSLEHTPPQLTARSAPEIRVRIAEGADAVDELQLTYRIQGEGASRVTMSPRDDGTFSARIPVVGDASSATDVAYFIVALAPSLSSLAHAGTEAEPLQLRIPAEGATDAAERPPILAGSTEGSETTEEGGSVLESWWFWTIIGALVVGGVATGIVLGTSQSANEGTLGTVRLMQLEF